VITQRASGLPAFSSRHASPGVRAVPSRNPLQALSHASPSSRLIEVSGLVVVASIPHLAPSALFARNLFSDIECGGVDRACWLRFSFDHSPDVVLSVRALFDDAVANCGSITMLTCPLLASLRLPAPPCL
jgi:hypothetical protein